MPPFSDGDILYLAVLQTMGCVVGVITGLALRLLTKSPVHLFKLWATGILTAILVLVTLSAVVGSHETLAIIVALLSLIVPIFGVYLIALPALFFSAAALRR